MKTVTYLRSVICPEDDLVRRNSLISSMNTFINSLTYDRIKVMNLYYDIDRYSYFVRVSQHKKDIQFNLSQCKID